MPVNQTQSSTGVLFGITQTGTGRAGLFKINNASSTQAALRAETNGSSKSAAVSGINLGTGIAGHFAVTNPYGRAELYVAERSPLGFTVELMQGDRNAQFSYGVVAKRLGFEAKRLERAPWADQVASHIAREPR